MPATHPPGSLALFLVLAVTAAPGCSAAPLVEGRQDPGLSARVLSRRALHYHHGAQPTADVPGHVRAGSAVAWVGRRLAVIQDDALVLGLVDPRRDRTAAMPLPTDGTGVRLFGDDRGNKKLKPDLEACLSVGDTLLAFGSGSRPVRERVLVFERASLAGLGRRPRLVDAGSLYRLLRARQDFSGSELNLEGATVVGDRVRLFQRGNGAPRGELEPVDATCELALAELLSYLESEGRSPPPGLSAVTRYHLGQLGGVRLTFTDAACTASGAVLFLASAEDSPDANRDGPVVGSAVGVLDPDGGARWARLQGPDGGAFQGKAEGLVVDPEDPTRAWVVLDADDTEVPADLCEVRLGGFP